MRWAGLGSITATIVLAACSAGSGGDVSAPGVSPDHHEEMTFEPIPYDAIGPNKVVFHRTIGNQTGVVTADGGTLSIGSSLSPGGTNIVAAPGGIKIAYEHSASSSETARAAELYVRDVAGTDAVAIGGSGGERAHPSWSPDGTRLIFTERAKTEPFGTSIVSQAVAGGAREVLWQAAGCEYAEHPSQNARGDLVFLFYPGDGGCALRQTIARKVNGGAVEVLYDAPSSSFILSAPVWSPTGNEIAYVDLFGMFGLGQPVKARVRLMNADGSNPRIFPVGTILYSPVSIPVCWSHDGSRLFFALVVASGVVPPVAHVQSIRVDGTGLTAITSATALDEWVSCP
jgi:Tol biopolymer transport system component